MATDPAHFVLVDWALAFAVSAGVVCGVFFALVCTKRPLLHAVVFSVLAVGIGFAIIGAKHCLMDDLDTFTAFCERTNWWPSLGNAVYWLGYWIVDGVYYWLIPQLIAQVFSAAITVWIKSRFKAAKGSNVAAI